MIGLPSQAPSSRRLTAGFTLLELFVVLALVALLAALGASFGASGNERAQRQQAEAELAVLSLALESFRRQYGGYPQTADPAGLARALRGEAGLDGRAGSGRTFLDPARHRWSAVDAGGVLLDPWARPYAYRHVARSPGRLGYVLYSSGPDGRAHPPDAAGGYDAAHPDNHDNAVLQQ